MVTSGSEKIGRSTHIPGEGGMWVFILGDAMLFVVYFSSYLFHRMAEPVVFRLGQATLNQTYGAINTCVLLVSSLFVFLGLQATRKKLTDLGPWMFAGAIVCALTFCALKVGEWSDKFHHNITPETNLFYLYYFILTRLHLMHVIFGIGVLTFLLVQSRHKQRSEGKAMFIEGGACWWHMLDMIWLILFPLVYLAR